MNSSNQIASLVTVAAMTKQALFSNAVPLTRQTGWLMLAYIVTSGSLHNGLDENDHFIASTLADGFSALLWVLIAVRIHRVLLPIESVMTDSQLGNAMSYFRFALRAFFLLMASTVVIVPVGLILIGMDDISTTPLVWLGVGFALFCLWFVAPLYISLPSIALKRPMNFSEAFFITRNYRLIVFAVVVLFPLVTTSLSLWLIFGLFESSKLLELISSLSTLCFVLIEIALLSMTYQFLIDKQHDTEFEH